MLLWNVLAGPLRYLLVPVEGQSNDVVGEGGTAACWTLPLNLKEGYNVHSLGTGIERC